MQYVREDWDDVKESVMVRINLVKFSQHKVVLDALLKTGDQRYDCVLRR
jgi:predicted NAD-dependent protein-ADP-ribosyltransferase YbiA (DUF1768 family)